MRRTPQSERERDGEREDREHRREDPQEPPERVESERRRLDQIPTAFHTAYA